MKNRFAKMFATLILVLMTGFFLSACGDGEKPKTETEKKEVVTPAPTGDTIKIGVAGAHSGDLASYGIPTVRAAKLVAEKVNANGGVLGKQIEIVTEDDVCKPEIATNTATKLITQNVNAVVGHICSGATKAAMGIYKDAGLVCISPSATNTDLTISGDYPNFFRTIAHDDAQAELQIKFALDVLKVKKIAVLHDKGDYGKGNAELARKYVEKAGTAEVILFEGVTPGAVDYSAIVQKVKRSGAEVVVWGGYHPEASRIIKQMKKKKMDAMFIGADGLKDETFIKTAGKYAEGTFVSGPIDVSSNPIAMEATEAHKAQYGEDPGAFFLQAYAATQALINAIEKTGGTDYDKLTGALRSEFVETSLGKISFDKAGDPIGVGFSMYQVENGQFVGVN